MMNSQCVVAGPRRLALSLAIAICVATLGVSLSLAEAKPIKGGNQADRLIGTKKSDKLIGRAGNDRLKGMKGRDTFKGGAGKDRLNAVDKRKDKRVDGGKGKDVCKIDASDRSVVKSCETVKVVGGPGGGGGGPGGGGSGGGGGGSGGGGGGSGGGGLVLTGSSGLSCAAGELPLCPFTLTGTGADSPVGTVTGGGGVTLAAGAGVAVVGEDWSAAGVYSCSADGYLRVQISDESIDVPVDCTGV